MTGRCVDRLRVTRGRAVATAVARRAQMRAAFDHLARNPDLGLARVVASFLVPPARVLGDAAALERFGLVLLREPVGGPLPDVANHVVDAVAIRREGADRCGALIGA